MLKEVLKHTPAYPYARRAYHWSKKLLGRRRPSRNDIYDAQTIEVMRRVLDERAVCVDVGAHIGTLLTEMFRFAPQGNHFAFEPLPHLTAELQRAFPRARVHQFALSNSSGRKTFHFVRNAQAYSGLVRRTYDRPDPIIEEIQVEVRRLDEIIPSDQKVSFIKLDIEGGEYHAMLGGAETIRRSRPFIVFEAGVKSTGHYGVSPSDIHQLITRDFGMQLSTMARWLSGRPPLSLPEFLETYRDDYYFLAYPETSEHNRSLE